MLVGLVLFLIVFLIILIIIKTQNKQKFKFVYKNTILYWLLILISILIGLSYNSWILGAVFFIVIYAIHEFLYYASGLRIIDDDERVATSYSWFNKYLNFDDANTGDLTEGYFKKDYKLGTHIETVTKAKYDKIFSLLQLKKGMRVLDIGNGYCHWARYLKKKDIEVVGITLSNEQQDFCMKHGIESHLINVENLPKFDKKFDAITALGSWEHFSKPHHDLNSQNNLYHKILSKLYDNIDKKSKCKKIFITTLHNNSKNYVYQLSDTFQSYLMERHYSGNYPKLNNLKESYLVKTALKSGKFKLKYISNKTEDYRWTSIISKKHFGNFKIDWNVNRSLYLLYMICSDPFWAQKWGYYQNKTWMWQLGGCDSIEYPKERETPAKLYWIMLQAI